MTIAWEHTIRTGDWARDQQELATVHQHAAAQGLRIEQAPIPGGGIHVRAIASGAMQPQPMQPAGPVPYGQPAARQVAQQAIVGGPGVCQGCGVHAETKKVTLVQNVGVIVLRFQRILTAQLCRTCIRRNFWRMTTIMFFFGWWGLISFIFTVIGIPANIVQYCRTFGMAKPTP